MSRRRSKRRVAAPAPADQVDAKPADEQQGCPTLSRRKLWAFRLAALVISPLAFFAICEFALGLWGYGYDAAFLKPVEIDEETYLTPNRQFTWRYFGERFSRHAAPFAAAQQRPNDLTRIIVFGESAAFGDPQPEFGLARMLQAVLELRRPEHDFEVISAAITGVNSHAIRAIADDCRALEADAWVVYMGNNEVVGPYGAGTVFGRQAPPLPLVRSSLALQTTRVGQLLTDLQVQFNPPPESKSEWGGMLMFVDNQVPAGDARLTRTYAHFESNLQNIVASGLESGAAVVVSTVACNLRDCPPFGSLHRPGLSDANLAQWDELVAEGKAAAAAGDNQRALKQFRSAAEIDDRVAELHFLMGHVLVRLERADEAREAFVSARDLDALRFRCDTKLNETTRRVAAKVANDRLALCDAAEALAKASPDGAPGRDLFYDHVHLTFEGNYLLARGIVDEIEGLLAEQFLEQDAGADDWPTQQDCARRLAWSDWHRQTALEDMLARYRDPPFVDQYGHEQELARRIREAAELKRSAALNRLAAVERCSAAVQEHPDDPVLQTLLAKLLGESGDADGAIEHAQRAVELLPVSGKAWTLLGAALATQQRFVDAAEAFQRAIDVNDGDPWALERLARAQAAIDRNDEAAANYRKAIALSPRFGPAYLGLGKVLEKLGRAEEAEANYRRAVENPVLQRGELVAMARFCLERGWNDEAAELFDKAIRLNPADADLYLHAGKGFSAQGDQATARRFYADAARIAPQLGEARFLLGMTYARQGDPQRASVHFEAAVRLMPESIEARLNYAFSLAEQGRRDEAIDAYEELLARDPDNARARRNLEALTAAPSGTKVQADD